MIGRAGLSGVSSGLPIPGFMGSLPVFAMVLLRLVLLLLFRLPFLPQGFRCSVDIFETRLDWHGAQACLCPFDVLHLVEHGLRR